MCGPLKYTTCIVVTLAVIAVVRSQVWLEELNCFRQSSSWLLFWPTLNPRALTVPLVSLKKSHQSQTCLCPVHE